MTCHCTEWRENEPKLGAPFKLLHARNPQSYHGYDGVKFCFCPWCGERLTSTPTQPDR